jgi:hypothetical protein
LAVGEGELHDLRDRVGALRDLLVVAAHRLGHVDGQRTQQPLLVAEDAVDRPRRGADLVRHAAHAHRGAALLVQQLPRGGEQCRPHLFTVLPWPSHLAILSSHRYDTT